MLESMLAAAAVLVQVQETFLSLTLKGRHRSLLKVINLLELMLYRLQVVVELVGQFSISQLLEALQHRLQIYRRL